MKSLNFLAAIILGAASLAAASAQTTYNFQALPLYTAVTNQFSGLTVSLNGGTDASGSAVTGSFGNPDLGNSNSGDYPTAEQLIFTFSGPTSGDSFGFSNYGNNDFADEGENPTMYYAYAGSTLVSSGDISSDNDDTFGVVVTGTGITSLVLDNGSDGNYNWEFGVSYLTVSAAATSATPEPASFVTLGTGLFGVAAQLYRRRRSSK